MFDTTLDPDFVPHEEEVKLFQALKALRVKNGLTTIDMATSLCVTREQIERLEKGEYDLTLQHLRMVKMFYEADHIHYALSCDSSDCQLDSHHDEQ